MSNLRIDKLAGMVALEARADAAYASLSEVERAAYDMATAAKPGVRRATKARLPRPSAPPAKPARNTAKRNFNRSVKQHFSAGRQLSSAHKKAISEGLKRWHAAHGRGKYTGRERRHAINHVNKHLQARVDHHNTMHQKHKLLARRKNTTHGPEHHQARAKTHLQKASHLKRAIKLLNGN